MGRDFFLECRYSMVARPVAALFRALWLSPGGQPAGHCRPWVSPTSGGRRRSASIRRRALKMQNFITALRRRDSRSARVAETLFSFAPP